MDIASVFEKIWRPGYGSVLPDEAKFLCEAIVQRRPKLFVEIGTATGLSTGLIATFMDVHGPGRLLSFDLNETFYGDKSKKVGFLIPKAYTGSNISVELRPREMSLDLANRLSLSSIDMAFIDAHHHHPWPTLDTIALLPFMRPEGLVFHHDIALFREQTEIRGIGPKYLFDQIPAHLRTLSPDGRSNIFSMVTPADYRLLENNLADALLLPWTPGLRLSPQHINRVRAVIKKHWGSGLLAAFNSAQRRFGEAPSAASSKSAGALPDAGRRFSTPEYRDVFTYRLPRITFRELSPLRDLLQGKTNLTVVDVGANHGLWSRAFLDCYGEQVGRLFMVEPLDGNNAILDKRIKDGFFEIAPENLTRLKTAVGEKDGSGELNFDKDTSELASLCLKESVFAQNRVPLEHKQTVTIQSLETIMEANKIEFIDVLKIDTEGFELGILKGAEALLQAARIKIACFEFGVNQMQMRQTFEDFWNLLTKHGYRMMRFNSDHLNGKVAIPHYSTNHEDFTKNVMLCAIAENANTPAST